MKWYLVSVIIQDDGQLEFDFMNTKKGYTVFSLGEDEDDAIDRMKKLHANRDDLEFAVIGEADFGKEK